MLIAPARYSSVGVGLTDCAVASTRDRRQPQKLIGSAMDHLLYVGLPPAIAWFTGNIDAHHVHHLSSRIPFYRLPQVLRDYPQLASVGRLTLLRSLRCASLAPWDKDQRRLISFRELHVDGSARRQLSARPQSGEAPRGL